MRLLLLKPLFLKKQSNLLKIGFEKSFQKINSFNFIVDLTLLLSKINTGMVVSAEKIVLLLFSTKENRKNTSTKKNIYSF
jgi:hypothetical protein